jgi:large subunit ribosomal protein L13
MTVSVPSEAIERRWHVVDAGGKVLGRLASQIAHVLRGKHKPVFSPHVDAGDFVIVINAAKIRLTGRKLEGKIYYRHTGYPGGIRQMTAGELLEKHPERMIEKAVRGMLPKNALGRHMLRKLKVYTDGDHPHAAQKPEALEIRV